MDITLFNRVSVRERALFTRSLSAMISAGLPLVQSLTLLSKETKNKYFIEVLLDIVASLEQGESFSSALSHHPKVFNRVYIASIKAAESSGKFEEIIKNLADQEAKEYKFSSSVKAAVAYPIFIILTIIIAGIILMVIVVPQLQTIFNDSNLTLPWTTRALIATANFFLNYGWVILVILAFFIVWARYFFFQNPAGRMFYGRVILTIPVLKDLFTGVYMVRFAGTLSMLVKAGVSIIAAVETVGNVIGNPVYQQILKDVANQLERGVPMSTPLSKSPEFPAVVSQMVAIGEQTGKLDEVMASLADLYVDETDKKVSLLTSLLEPILLVIVGLGVGMVVFSIIVPIYQISSSIE